MKKLLSSIRNRHGIVTVIMLFFLLGVGVLTLNTMLNSQMNQTSSNNYKYKIQTFYAADGLMTLLAQDMIDANEDKYLVDRMAHKDIGSPITAGSYSYDKIKNTDTIKGAGNDIWNSSDQFHYLYSRVKGDIDISVKVVSMTNTDAWAKTGIMIREKLTGPSKQAMVCRPYNSATGIRLQYRTTEGGITVDNLTSSTDAQWIRIKRSGNSFNAYRSSNGSTWVLVSTQIVSMSDSVYAGLVVTSHSPGVLCKGVFSNLLGLTRRSCIDSTFVGTGSDIPVKYTINETGSGIFSMNTQGYKVKGSLKTPNYSSSLNQTISRARIEDYYSTATDSVFIPVTFYDMRADGSNPEFNVEAFVHKPCPPCTSHAEYFYPHLIDLNNLTADRKPIKYNPSATFRTNFMSIWSSSWYTLSSWDRSVTNCYNATPAKLSAVFTNDESKFTWCFNDSMHTWFRPYGDSAGKSGTYTYDYLTCRWSGLKVYPNWVYAPGHDTEWVTQYWNSTNPHANIVIYDTLKFIEDPANRGVFSFGKDRSDQRWFVACNDCDFLGGNCNVWAPKFMPLWYQGFGYDCVYRYWMGKGADTLCFVKQNFSFTMEMHRKFTYKPGQVFEFTGDDDVWVFINNRCVIDLGGVHEAAYKKVILDTLGLIQGNEYLFDFFYCERDVTTSNIMITTNMLLFTPPQTSKRNWKRDYGNVD